jgi:1-pyrroline-5-carboxylate dehydrogenase
VINLVYGRGSRSATPPSEAPTSPASTSPARPASSRTCGSTVGANIERYRNYPRIVGETGGKDFIVAHPSADVDSLATAIVRGSFEYQGQKCSAASRVYAPSNLWPELRERLAAQVAELKVGDVDDFGNFMGAVIDCRLVRDAEGGDRGGAGERRLVGPRRRRLRRHRRLLRQPT